LQIKIASIGRQIPFLMYHTIHKQMKYFITTAIALCFALNLLAQEQKHVVFLKNKDNNPYSVSNPSAYLSQRALDRRTKASIAIDVKDLPVTPSYVTQIAATGAVVVYPLKWFNAVVVNTNDPQILAAIAALPFVDHIDEVLKDAPAPATPKPGTQSVVGIPPYTIRPAVPVAHVKSANVIDYGQAYNQVHMMKVDGLHNLGFMGEGMMIAILDAGFHWVDQIDAFDSLWMNNRILGTRDFNLPGNNVFGDNMHTHGTSVLSCMGGNLPGQMVGTAPHASFWLIRTEVGDYEALIEEYNWAAGAEFADSLGADIINSSLGYTEFDNPVYNHTYADLDGNTTPVTRAADLATSRGILVVNSAGNEGGSSWHYIGAPADGDSVFSIGAVDGAGNYAYFSSVGPTYDGRTKPDVAAQGDGTTVVSGWGSVGQGSGTSFSSPLTAGALACLWQSAPSYSAEQVRNAVRSTASQASAPDQYKGWGIPNMMNALTLLSTSDKKSLAGDRFSLYPMPFAQTPVLRDNLAGSEPLTIEILSVTGQTLSTEKVPATNGTISLSQFDSYPAGIYFLRLTSGDVKQTMRAIKL